MAIIEHKDKATRSPENRHQWFWFVGLYLAGLATTALLVYGLRMLLGLS